MTVARANAIEHPSAVSITTRTITTLPALERELHEGLLRAWTELVQLDPLASCFQSPGWCMPWYRSYHDEFDPFVVVVTREGALAGIVPLAVRRSTGELSFASGTMADYRDIVAVPDARFEVVSELLRVYRGGRFPNPLQIGWIDPASDTPALVARACADAGLRFISWQQPCHRWFPVEGENLNKKFSRVRTHLNHFKRLGDVTFDVITGQDDWRAFRTAFFRQHSLRQLQADRVVSFDDPRKQRFYDRLFDSSTFQTHVTALRMDGQLLSGHIGLVWRDVLMLGAPSISIEHEQRSPALILLSWVMQNAGELGLKGFDLTVGDTDFKKRLGNQCVPVTMMEVYGSAGAYHLRAARIEAVAIAKGVAAAFLGEDAWKTRVKPSLERLARQVEIARDEGLAAAMRGTAARAADVTPGVEELTRADVERLDAAAGDTPWLWRENQVEDLLLSAGSAGTTARAIRECARTFSKQRSAGATLHTLVLGDRLAAFCFCRVEAGVAHVTGLHVAPDVGPDGAEAVLVSRVGRAAFTSGASRLRVTRG